jgi:hypothetical protein
MSAQSPWKTAPHRAICLILGVLALLAAPAFGDANAIENPDLDVDATAWAGGSWSPVDSGSCSSSGSLAVTSVSCAPVIGCVDFGFWRAFAGTCVEVAPGMTVHQAAVVRSNQPTFLYLSFFSDAGCGAAAGDNVDDAVAVPAGEWQPISRTSTIPDGVHSVVAAFASGGFASSNVTGNVDRAWLGLEDRLFADGFEQGSTCRWSSSAG